VEARLALARAEGAARRPAAGLRALDQARALARESARPDLLALCHREAERLWKLEGDREAARQALRAARAIWRRCTADRHPPRNLPLHGLFHLGAGREESGPAPDVAAPGRAR
jgi:ATP/maltotriose-dependent transcriptional regulator MalT